jgi:hypothetical protein
MITVIDVEGKTTKIPMEHILYWCEGTVSKSELFLTLYDLELKQPCMLYLNTSTDDIELQYRFEKGIKRSKAA